MRTARRNVNAVFIFILSLQFILKKEKKICLPLALENLFPLGSKQKYDLECFSVSLLVYLV